MKLLEIGVSCVGLHIKYVMAVGGENNLVMLN